MSLKLAAKLADAPKKKRDRAQILALMPDLDYSDGRTKQCHRDECDINKIMARAQITGTISHVNRFEGVYADFSDYDFHEQTRKLAAGREIFANLDAELRREFQQDPAKFFEFVNDPENKDDLLEKLPALARPGDQLPTPQVNASEPTVPVEPPADPPADPPAEPPA